MVRNGKICVSEVFLSVNGEAPFAGYASVFFRVAGCNLRCEWCDTKYAYEEDETCVWYTVAQACRAISECADGCGRVTITGGEPLMEENKPYMKWLIQELLDRNYVVCVETNGSIDYSYWVSFFSGNKNFVLVTDWKCPGSGMNGKMKPENLGVLREWDVVKCVVAGDEDLAEVHRLLLKRVKAQIVVSPCFGKIILSKLPNFVTEHKECKNLSCQVQLHKIFWESNRRGV